MERRFRGLGSNDKQHEPRDTTDGTTHTQAGAGLAQRRLAAPTLLALGMSLLTACVAGPQWGQDSYNSTATDASSFVIDNESSNQALGLDTETVWWESSSTPGFRGNSYAVAPTANDNSKPARFWFKLSQGACFDVAARWTSGQNRSTNVTFRGQNDSGVTVGQAQVDQSRDGGTWNDLGRWNFPAGQGSVVLSRKGAAGKFVVADAIRLTRCGTQPVEGTSDAPSNSTPSTANQVALAVPYFYQYANAYEPSATCGITSAAMAINYWLPNNLTPDKLYAQYGKAKGQSPEGIASLSKSRGLKAKHTRSGTREQIRAHLRAGRPVVVHGFWTGPGHIAVIVGFDSSGWIVNDPAGDWEACYGCSSVAGKNAHYSFGGAWDQKLSYDGDIWYSTSDTRSF